MKSPAWFAGRDCILLMTEILKQPSLLRTEKNNCLQICGKAFDIAPHADTFRFVRHEDYPLINDLDVAAFISYATKRKALVISGCKARIHPYRIMYIDEAGYGENLVDIPQSIRGNRHLYPEIYEFVPALIGLPPRQTVDRLLKDGAGCEIYLMPEEKLLDCSNSLERLLIQSILEKSEIESA